MRCGYRSTSLTGRTDSIMWKITTHGLNEKEKDGTGRITVLCRRKYSISPMVFCHASIQSYDYEICSMRVIVQSLDVRPGRASRLWSRSSNLKQQTRFWLRPQA
jgi:hypothetical protein